MSALFRVALLSLCALALAMPVADAWSQATSDTSIGPAPTARASVQPGPTLQSLTVGARAQSVTPDMRELAAQRRNAGLGQPEALMIVGGAAFLLGAIIGKDPGTVMMVGGAIVGLYGLYKYLQ